MPRTKTVLSRVGFDVEELVEEEYHWRVNCPDGTIWRMDDDAAESRGFGLACVFRDGKPTSSGYMEIPKDVMKSVKSLRNKHDVATNVGNALFGDGHAAARETFKRSYTIEANYE